MYIQAPLLKGSAEIRVIDSITGEIKQVIKKTNVVCNWLYLAYVELQSPSNGPYNPYYNTLYGTKISIATQNLTPNVSHWRLDGIQATGFIASGVTTPTFDENVNPPYWQLQNRINFIGVSRDFNTVCLTNGLASNDNHNPTITNTNVAAWLKLDTPCTQGPTDILDIFYRIQLVQIDQSVRIGPSGAKDCYRALIGATRQDLNYYNFPASRGTFWPALISFGPVSKPASNFVYNDISQTEIVEYGLVLNLGNDPNSPNPYTTSNRRSLFKRRYNCSFDANTEIGRIINHIVYGKLDPYHYWPSGDTNYNLLGWSIDEATQSTNIVQAKYSHSAAATVPMQDNQNLATGSGIFTFTGTTGTWTNKYPQIWEPEITSTGDVGAATYRLKVRNFFGQLGNTWTERASHNPLFSPTRSLRSGGHGEKARTCTKYNSSVIVQWDTTGITVVDIMNGSYINFDATTTPALNATNIGQVEVNQANGDIWVGCRNTGLYKVTLTGGLNPTYAGGTVTKMTTVACYGVDVGRNGRVYALLEGRLSNSDDFSVALPFSYTSISDGNWSQVCLLKADPEHVDDRIGIAVWYTGASLYNTNNGNKSRIVWWSQAAGATTGYWTNDGIAVNAANSSVAWPLYNNFFNVSDTSSFWAVCWFDGGIYRTHSINWGTTEVNGGSLLGPGNESVPTVPLLNVYFEKDIIIGRTSSYDRDGTAVEGIHRSLEIGYRFVYMGKGVGHFGNILLSVFNNSTSVNGTSGASIPRNPLLWDYYEWNGSAWVLRDWSWNSSTNTWTQASLIGSKVTHATSDSIPFGLTLSWQTGTSSPHFVNTNYYTQYLCKGIYKDVSNTFSHEFSFYGKPLKIEQPLSATIPATAPYRVIAPKSVLGGSPDNSFAGLDHDQSYNHNISIAGYGTPVATIYGDPTATPGPNEVLVNPSNGALIFNSADAGKAVTGNYTYVSGIQDYPHPIRTFLSTPGLLCGFESDVSVTSSGGLVSSWGESSGSTITVSQATSGNRPTIVNSGPNGLPYIDFTSGKFLQFNQPESFADFHRGITLVMVMRQVSDTYSNILCLSNGNSLNQSIEFIKQSSSGNLSFTVAYDTGNVLNNTVSTSLVTNEWNTIILSVMPDTSRFIRVNTSQVIIQAGPHSETMMYTSRNNPRNNCYIGATSSGNASSTAMQLACLYIMDTGLTSRECSALETSLKTKYALTTY